MEIVKNAQGKVYYGVHFYPGVAEYQSPEGEPYRVFLNENTLRSMDPTFSGRPVFVEHVDEVDPSLDELRKEADGWVVESFYNSADGKHWVKFIIVSDRAERAIKNGLKLSNAYLPQSFSQGGLWNGVPYTKEITKAEYEHLAIVKDPRYAESIIMTPEEFKKHNEEKVVELKRLANSQEKQGETKMAKFNFFKRTKVENALDLEQMSVMLPLSQKEVSLSQLINDMDMMEDAMKKNEVMADMGHKVKMMDGSMCNVGDLMEMHKAMKDELEALKAPKKDEMEEEKEVDLVEAPVDVEGDKHNEDMEMEKKAKDEKEMKMDEDKAEKALEEEKKQNEIKKKADALRNAHLNPKAPKTVELMEDQVARGKARYGSSV